MGAEREQAFAEGCAPALACAIHADIARALSAERAPHYLNLLYALLLMRRGHELEPRHEDLYARVHAPQRLLGTYDPEEYARDLEQLIGWGAIDRLTEAQRLRGYKDNRRIQYRYRITDDAVALIEWLESRLAQSLEGRVADSRDRLADIVGSLKECRRLLDGRRKGTGDGDSDRRCYYLLELCADAVTAISDELLAFRAQMVLFAQRPYDGTALRQILTWLERYVELYIQKVRQLRIEIRDRLAQLGAPRYLSELAACAGQVEEELRLAPRPWRAAPALRAPADLLGSAELFFRHGGRLEALCRAIEDSARQVVVKMHRHIRELERRSARLDELRATITALASGTFGEGVGYPDYLLASGHGRFDVRPGSVGHRVAPPAPRKHQLPNDRRAAALPLATKQLGVESARSLRAKAMAELRVWLSERVSAAGTCARLSELGLSGPGDMRKWMDVARTHHLSGPRLVQTLGVELRAIESRAQLGDDEVGLDAPDCEIRLDKETP